MLKIENRANKLMNDAEKKISSFSFFPLFSNKSNKFDEAVKYYTRAAYLFKVSKNWMKAAHCFLRCAELNRECNNIQESGENFVLAANCFNKCDCYKSIENLEKAIDIFTLIGKVGVAAKVHQNIAETYELQLLDLKSAVYHYEQANNYFKMENNEVDAVTCSLKCAHYAAIFEDYQKAIEIYQQIVLSYFGCPTTMENESHIYLLKSALCHLCANLLCGKQVIQKYTELFPAFRNSIEGKYLVQLAESIDTCDFNEFITSRFTFCTNFKCDYLITTLLKRIEKILSNGVKHLQYNKCISV